MKYKNNLSTSVCDYRGNEKHEQHEMPHVVFLGLTKATKSCSISVKKDVYLNARFENMHSCLSEHEYIQLA